MSGSAEGRRNDGKFDEILIDNSRAIVLMEWEHHIIHLGKLFFISDRTTSAATIKFLFRTGPSELHIKFVVTTGAKVTVDIIEAPTVSIDGTPVTPQNYKRSSVVPIGLSVFKGPTYSGGNTFRLNQAGFGSNRGQAVSGNNATGIEYVFSANTDYVLLLTPSTSTDVVTIADFYEIGQA